MAANPSILVKDPAQNAYWNEIHSQLQNENNPQYLAQQKSYQDEISSQLSQENNPHPVLTQVLNDMTKGMGVAGATGGAQYLPGMVAGFGTGVQNLYNNLSGLSNKFIGTNLPQSNTNLYNTLGVPQSAQQGIPGLLNKAAQYAPMLLAPEARIPDALGWLAKIGNPLANIATQAGSGALLSQNPAEAAKGFGGVQAAIESASPLAKAAAFPLKAFGELVNPIGEAKNFINSLATKYADTKSDIKDAYSYMNPYKQEQLFNPVDADSINKSYLQSFPYKLRNSVQNFLVNPTIDLGHKLQSDMFKTANTINQKAVLQSDRDSAAELMDKRQFLVNTIKNKLNDLDPVAAQNYQTGSDLTRDVLTKLTPTKLMTQFAKGNTSVAQPTKIVTDYNNAVGKGLINPNDPEDFISNSIQKLSQKEKMGHFWQEAIPTALGSLSGGAYGSPIEGGIGGAIFGKYAEPYMIKNMIQNEGLHQAVQAGGQKARNALKYLVPPVVGSDVDQNSLNTQTNKNTVQ